MAFTHAVTIGVQPAGTGVTRTASYSASSELALTETIADSSTDFQIVAAIDVSAVKSFYVVSDKAVTLETNNGTTPDDTISLKAGIPYIWNTDSYDTFKLGTDVTDLFITNASGGTATLELRCVQDATP